MSVVKGSYHHFVCDENFPFHIGNLKWPPAVKISRLVNIAPSLQSVDDWQVINGLHRRGDIHGLITNDGRMLNLPREMVALSCSKLALIVTDGVGNDPIRATGLVMVHLQDVVKQLSGYPQIFRLHPSQVKKQKVKDQIDKVAGQFNTKSSTMISQELRAMGLTHN